MIDGIYTAWVCDIKKVRTALEGMSLIVSRLAINPMLKEELTNNIRRIEKLLGKGKTKGASYEHPASNI